MRDRPLADAGDREQAALVVGRGVELSPRDRERHAGERARLRGGEAGGLEPRGVGQRVRQRRRPRALGVPRAVAAGERPGDVAGALGVDQLLDDRPRQRLERLRLPQHAQLRARLHDAAEQRVRAVRAVERFEVVVEREHEAQPGERRLRRRLGARLGAQVHVLAAPRRLGQRELVPDADRAPHDVALDADQAARPGRARRLARPGWPHGQIDDHRARSTSSSSKRASGSSSASPNSSRSRPSR